MQRCLTTSKMRSRVLIPTIAIDYPNALVARGNLAGALNQVAASTVAGTVHFTWDDNSGEVGASALDKTLLVVYNPAQHQAVTINQLAERADGTQTITVPDSFSGDLVQCYIAFINRRWCGLQQRLCRCRNCCVGRFSDSK